jgi:membrane protease YdiL (CAAX protease family)
MIGNTVVSVIVYYSAFILPILLSLIYIFANKNVFSSETKIEVWSRSSPHSLLLIFPTVALMIGVSSVMGALKSKLGYAAAPELDEPFLLAVLLHALIPAILEELLFRYAPIKILGGSAYTVGLSSIFFALAHTDVFSIPHALVAGVALAVSVIASGSILPAIILHFINNLTSLTMSYYPSRSMLTVYAVIILAVLSASVAIILGKRFLSLLKTIGTEREEYGAAPLAFVALSLFIALTKLIR